MLLEQFKNLKRITGRFGAQRTVKLDAATKTATGFEQFHGIVIFNIRTAVT
jgi:hypothetical protein